MKPPTCCQRFRPILPVVDTISCNSIYICGLGPKKTKGLVKLSEFPLPLALILVHLILMFLVYRYLLKVRRSCSGGWIFFEIFGIEF